MKEAAVFLGTLAFALLWSSVIAPTIARAFGVRAAIGFRLDRKNQHLSRRQFFWACGVLSVGIGIFICTVGMDLGDQLSQMRSKHTISSLVIALIAGASSYGVAAAPHREAKQK